MVSAMVSVPLLLQRNYVQGTSFVTWNLVFSNIDRLEDQEDLIGDFTDATEAITVTIHAQDVVNNVFLGP
jgi:hypothetical protein